MEMVKKITFKLNFNGNLKGEHVYEKNVFKNFFDISTHYWDINRSIFGICG